MNVHQPAIEAAADMAESRPGRAGLAPRLAWSAWALSIALIILNLILVYGSNPALLVSNLVVNTLGWPTLFVYSTVGAFVASRRPQNPIGWIFCAAALLVAFGSFAEEYARYALLAHPGALPAGPAMAWLSGWLQNLGFLLMFTLVLLLFPNGQLPSRRWRTLAWLAVGAIALLALMDAIHPGPVRSTLSVNNPLGIDSAGELVNQLEPPIFLFTIMACAVSVVVRFRRAQGDERLQLKWFAFAAVLGIAQFGIRMLLGVLSIALPEAVDDGLLILSLAAFPVAAGIAILKYHLYHIDLLINRTLVYVPLTAILAGVYSASMTVLQKLFLALTGEHSDAAIVITTLILVSSFTPVKDGLQGIVNRRFKEVPDPTRKLQSFGEQVRSFVQLSSAELIRQRLLDEAIAAFDARGGAIYLRQQEQMQLLHARGEWDGEAQISVPLEGADERLSLVSLGARRNGHEYTPQDQQILKEIVDVVAQAIEVAQRTR